MNENDKTEPNTSHPPEATNDATPPSGAPPAVEIETAEENEGGLKERSERALKGLSAKVDEMSEAADPFFKDASKKIDQVIDDVAAAVDPALKNAGDSAKRLGSEVKKRTAPLGEQLKRGVGSLADKLGSWARGDEEE